MESPGIFGSSFFSRTVNPSADLDEKALQEIADATGGQYFRARTAQDLANIYHILDELEAIESEHLSFRPKRSLFFWFLGAAFTFSILYAALFLLSNLIQRNRSSEEASNV